MSKQGKKGHSTKGKRFKLGVWDTWKAVFKANHFALKRMPLMTPRTDEELAEFMAWELDDATIDTAKVKRCRTDFNAGRMTKGIAPKFISLEYTKEQTNDNKEEAANVQEESEA